MLQISYCQHLFNKMFLSTLFIRILVYKIAIFSLNAFLCINTVSKRFDTTLESYPTKKNGKS